MMRRARIIIIAGVLFAALTGQATLASEVTDRGYRNCEEALNAEFRNDGLMFKREYYLKKSPTSKTYFINGTLWANDNTRTEVKLTCKTSFNGRSVLALESNFGKYTDENSGLAVR